MNGHQVVNGLNNIFIWTTRLAYLNLLWFIFSLSGLFVFGIFPATVAALRINMQWIRGNTDIALFKSFKDEFIKHLTISNLSGWLMIGLGVILVLNFNQFQNFSGNMYFISVISFYFIVILYLTLMVWIFPLISYYNNNLKNYFKNALIIGFGKIVHSIMILFCQFIIAYILLKFPGLIPFFSISVSTFLWAFITLKIFKGIDERNRTNS